MKWLCFLTCCALCIWKIAESFATYGEQEVGTKIELKYNQETDLPSFAVCRHPNQILAKMDKDGSELDSYRIKLSDIRYLTAFETSALYGFSTEDLYRRFLFNDSESVMSLVLSSRGQYAGTATPSLVSRPMSDKKEWSSFWHPLFGVCFTFKLDKPLAEVVGDAGLEFVKVNLNFEKAFPKKEEPATSAPEILDPYEPSRTEGTSESYVKRESEPASSVTSEAAPEAETTTEVAYYIDLDKPDNITLYTGDETETTTKHNPRHRVLFSPDNFRLANSLNEEAANGKEAGVDEMVVIAFETGRFLTSLELSIITREKNEYYTFTQEVVDKVKIKHIVNCTEYTEEQSEDSCLFSCLVTKFVNEFDCIHPRIALMNSTVDMTEIMDKYPICQAEHLQSKTDEYKEKLEKQNPEEPPKTVEEFGLTRIREIMAGFQSTQPEPRCDCQLSCSRKLFTIQSWRSDAKNKNELETGQKNGYAFFQFAPDVKIYSYFQIYTEDNLVADIGGYLGLFLGLSVFSLFEILETLVEKIEKKEDEKNKAKEEIGLDVGDQLPRKGEANGLGSIPA